MSSRPIIPERIDSSAPDAPLGDDATTFIAIKPNVASTPPVSGGFNAPQPSRGAPSLAPASTSRLSGGMNQPQPSYPPQQPAPNPIGVGAGGIGNGGIGSGRGARLEELARQSERIGGGVPQDRFILQPNIAQVHLPTTRAWTSLPLWFIKQSLVVTLDRRVCMPCFSQPLRWCASVSLRWFG